MPASLAIEQCATNGCTSLWTVVRLCNQRLRKDMDMEQVMELGTIERNIQVDASPEVVFEVVSRPEHISEWWPDEADLDPVPGGSGQVRWRDGETGEVKAVD